MRISDWSSDVCSSDLLDVIDVGANIGLFTVLAGKRLGTGRVLAAEPTDGAFSRLTANVKNNGVSDRVILYNGLIAQSDGMAMLNVVKGRDRKSTRLNSSH